MLSANEREVLEPPRVRIKTSVTPAEPKDPSQFQQNSMKCVVRVCMRVLCVSSWVRARDVGSCPSGWLFSRSFIWEATCSLASHMAEHLSQHFHSRLAATNPSALLQNKLLFSRYTTTTGNADTVFLFMMLKSAGCRRSTAQYFKLLCVCSKYKYTTVCWMNLTGDYILVLICWTKWAFFKMKC